MKLRCLIFGHTLGQKGDWLHGSKARCRCQICTACEEILVTEIQIKKMA